MTADDLHTVRSSYRQMLLEHLIAGEVMKHLRLEETLHLEILKPQVDDSGYDIVLEAGGIVRHVQLKASFEGAKVRSFYINLALAAKPSGCVVLVKFDPGTLDLGPFGFVGGMPGEPLPDLSGFKTTKHTKADSTGTKKERPNLRSLPLSRFEMVDSIPELTIKLFGTR